MKGGFGTCFVNLEVGGSALLYEHQICVLTFCLRVRERKVVGRNRKCKCNVMDGIWTVAPLPFVLF